MISPSNSSNYVTLQIGTVLLRDYSTGTLTQGSANSLTSTSLTTSGSSCTCNNVLEEAEFNFIIGTTMYSVFAVNVNLILGTNIQYNCNDNYIITQKYTTKFLTSSIYDYTRSGSPGYLEGLKLMVAYNSTNSDGTAQFTVPKDGFYMVGRQPDGTCSEVSGSNYSIDSQYDSPILYGVNSVYSCVNSMNLDSYRAFCQNKSWKNFVLFNFVQKLQYVGIFGSADYQHLLDWTEVLTDFNLDNSTWTEDTKSCYLPEAAFLDVLTSEAGAINNPQNYVLSARVSTKYESVAFLSLVDTDVLPFTFRFIVNYIPLTENQLTATRNTPSIIPLLPSDIAAPLISSS